MTIDILQKKLKFLQYNNNNDDDDNNNNNNNNNTTKIKELETSTRHLKIHRKVAKLKPKWG